MVVSLLFDSGIRSGIEAARAVALGADAVFSGRGYLMALAALGKHGPRHLSEVFADEFTIALAQHGAFSVAEVRSLAVRHPGEWCGAPESLGELEVS